MATPRKKAEDLPKMEGSDVENMDIIQKPMEKLLAPDYKTDKKMLRLRIDEQSALICMLKRRADELLLRCQALEQIGTDLEDQATQCQKQLNVERKRSETLEKRLSILAATSQGIAEFMEEHKKHNVQLKLKNDQLQSENDSLFSQKLQDKEVFVQKLQQDIKLLTEKYTNEENQYREKLDESDTKLQDQADQYQTKEALLHDQLLDAQQQHTQALEMWKELKLRFQETEKQHAEKEASMSESLTKLTKEKDKLLSLCMERGKIIQDKQEEIQQLQTKWKEEKKACIEAQERFKIEAEAVNKDAKVKSLQTALDESAKTMENMQMDFDAFKEHSVDLLTQERELNKKLRHLMG